MVMLNRDDIEPESVHARLEKVVNDTGPDDFIDNNNIEKRK